MRRIHSIRITYLSPEFYFPTRCDIKIKILRSVARRGTKSAAATDLVPTLNKTSQKYAPFPAALRLCMARFLSFASFYFFPLSRVERVYIFCSHHTHAVSFQLNFYVYVERFHILLTCLPSLFPIALRQSGK